MVNKVLGYYTTDDKYRPTASNHIDKIKYCPDSMVLTIGFYNGAVYEYYGVPQGLYTGMMASPSHGVFFWHNLRQRFPYKLIDRVEPYTSEHNGVGKGTDYKAMQDNLIGFCGFVWDVVKVCWLIVSYMGKAFLVMLGVVLAIAAAMS